MKRGSSRRHRNSHLFLVVLATTLFLLLQSLPIITIIVVLPGPGRSNVTQLVSSIDFATQDFYNDSNVEVSPVENVTNLSKVDIVPQSHLKGDSGDAVALEDKDDDDDNRVDDNNEGVSPNQFLFRRMRARYKSEVSMTVPSEHAFGRDKQSFTLESTLSPVQIRRIRRDNHDHAQLPYVRHISDLH